MDAAADRRLREVQRARRSREAASPHDRHEGLDLVELHQAISIANDRHNIYAFDSCTVTGLSSGQEVPRCMPTTGATGACVNVKGPLRPLTPLPRAGYRRPALALRAVLEARP